MASWRATVAACAMGLGLLATAGEPGLLGDDEGNLPPVCEEATLSPGPVGPPSGELVGTQVLGVVDPDGDPVTIRITGIAQDEPVLEEGSGTCPDGVLVDTDGNGVPDAAALRSERTGSGKAPGNGRAYVVSFVASDGRGGQTAGSATWCVAGSHPGGSCFDDGERHDSAVCEGAGPGPGAGGAPGGGAGEGAPAEGDGEGAGPGEPGLGTIQQVHQGYYFIRGDVNRDGCLGTLDAVLILRGLFVAGELPSCEDAVDVDDNGALDISDPIYLFTCLYRGRCRPPPPCLEPGPDPTPDELICR